MTEDVVVGVGGQIILVMNNVEGSRPKQFLGPVKIDEFFQIIPPSAMHLRVKCQVFFFCQCTIFLVTLPSIDILCLLNLFGWGGGVFVLQFPVHIPEKSLKNTPKDQI